MQTRSQGLFLPSPQDRERPWKRVCVKCAEFTNINAGIAVSGTDSALWNVFKHLVLSLDSWVLTLNCKVFRDN